MPKLDLNISDELAAELERIANDPAHPMSEIERLVHEKLREIVKDRVPYHQHPAMTYRS